MVDHRIRDIADPAAGPTQPPRQVCVFVVEEELRWKAPDLAGGRGADCRGRPAEGSNIGRLGKPIAGVLPVAPVIA